MIAFGICSHGIQLSGYDRGELGIVFSDQVIALEELLKENLKKSVKNHQAFYFTDLQLYWANLQLQRFAGKTENFPHSGKVHYQRSWLRDGIFYFGLDRKIPKISKSRGSRSGFENPGRKFEILSKNIGKIFGFSRFSDYRDFFGISWKSPGFLANPRDSEFFSLGIFILGIFIPGIRDFFSLGIFLNFGICIPDFFREIPGIFFFVGWVIPAKSHLLLSVLVSENFTLFRVKFHETEFNN